MGDNKQSVIFKEYAKTKDPNAKVVTMSLKMEEEAILNAATGKNKEEKEKLYNDIISRYDVEGSRMNDLHQATMELLPFQKFYTVSSDHVSSWLVPDKTTAEEAAEKMQLPKRLKSVDISYVRDWERYGGSEKELDANKRWRNYRPDYLIENEDVIRFN